jgi:tetratricopeptide (TPR) repeat protein
VAVAAQNVARAVGWSFGCVLAPVLLGAMFGPRWVAVGALISVVATLWLILWLPRSAHAAFQEGRYPRAGRRYALIASMSFTTARERMAVLSRSGCEVAAGRSERAEALLGSMNPALLDTAERVVWLNNRACAALDAGREPAEALTLVDEAIALRPDVPAVQHTRARALLGVGRIDDAIAVLDAMRSGGELTPRLEADRCKDLATAWETKGHAEYADDYRERARLVATR